MPLVNSNKPPKDWMRLYPPIWKWESGCLRCGREVNCNGDCLCHEAAFRSVLPEDLLGRPVSPLAQLGILGNGLWHDIGAFDPVSRRMSTKRAEAFINFLDKQELGYETPCLIWTAYKCKDGYGRFYTGEQGANNALSHRAWFEHLYGPLCSKTQLLDHLCRNHSCCNPDHLEPVTNRVNVIRGNSARRIESLAAQGQLTMEAMIGL